MQHVLTKRMKRDKANMDRPSVFASIVGIVCYGSTLGFVYPLLSLLMTTRGIGTTDIGLNAAAMGLGLLASTLALPVLTRHVSLRLIILYSFLGSSFVICGFGFSNNLVVWMSCRVALGAFSNNIFVLTEALANSACSDRFRGRVMASYTTGLSTGFAVGPIGVLFLGVEGALPFVVCALVTALGGLVFLSLANSSTAILPPLSLREICRFFGTAPVLILAAMSFGFADWAGLSIMPLYFVQDGMTLEAAALTVTAAHCGMVALQGPIGMALDRLPGRFVFITAAMSTAASAILLVILPSGSWTKWVSVFMLGGFSCGVYTSALTLLGRRAKGEILVAGSTVFSIAYTGAGMVGLAGSSVAMDVFGAAAFPVSLALVFGILAVVLVYASDKRKK